MIARLIAGLLAITLTAALALAQPTDEAEREELRRFLEDTINSAESFEDRFDAEVWLTYMSRPLSRFVKDPEERLDLLKEIHAAASRAGVPPDLVLAVIEIESHFDRFAISRVGAQGMMQVMPFWKDEIGRPEDNLTQNKTNFEYGCRILQFYMQREDGHLHKALARYNGSVGSRRYSNKVYRAWSEHWRYEDLNWAD